MTGRPVASETSPWRRSGAGLMVRVRLTPKASRDAIEGIEESAEGPALKARVRAVPADGEANAALVRLLAEWLDVPRGSVSLAGGQKSRIKTLKVEGDPQALEKLAQAALQPG